MVHPRRVFIAQAPALSLQEINGAQVACLLHEDAHVPLVTSVLTDICGTFTMN